MNKRIVWLMPPLLFISNTAVVADLSRWETNPIQQKIHEVPQNAIVILNHQHNQYYVNRAFQKKLSNNFLNHYFEPWFNPYAIGSAKEILKDEQHTIVHTMKHSGWDENLQKHNPAWIRRIAKNMHLESFPNLRMKAITINATSLRALPSDSPMFGNPKKAGEGFPFDYLQKSYLNSNLPIYILHTTRNGAWDLVLTPERSWGWVPSKDIAIVNNRFIQAWAQKRAFVTPIEEQQPVLDSHSHFYFLTRIGEILPLVKQMPISYHVLVAVKDSMGNAEIKIAKIYKKSSKLWPLPASSKSIASLANKLLGAAYGWGGLYSYRDCSATLKDLFAPFAIWLPRSSGDQARAGHYVSLARKDSPNKAQTIMQNGIPFFTLLWLHGHIMLYIGSDQDQLYAFHSPWGVHTMKSNTEGRILIGQAVITPLNLGQGLAEVPQTWLDKLNGFTHLVPVENLDFTNDHKKD